jgi:hypothetical protein
VARAAAAGDEGLVVIDRRHFAALAVLVVLLLALAGLLAWRVWGTPEPASLSEPIVVNATLAPDQHLFGDPVRARVELIIDSSRIDPDTVRLRASFAPYRPLRPVERSETAAGNVTRLRFDYQLACLGYRCRPLGQRRFELRNATVEYRSRGRDAVQTEEIDWPALSVTGRISRTRFWEAQLRSEFREVGQPTYRFAPRTVAIVALALAVIFGAGALILILRLLPLGRIAERLGLKTVDRRSSLERALARVHETSTADRPHEGRRALERLAQELRRERNPQLAGAASQLAWSREFPADGRLTALTGEVERLISKRRT